MAGARVLVISDIHLGEILYNEDAPGLADYVHALNRELADFVATHRERRPPEGSWHLVINGDMFDFVKLARLGDATSVGHEQASAIRERLARIVKVHEPLFHELAVFLLEGHRITIIEGNHDAEVYWREVRTDLRNAVMRLAHRHQESLQQAPIAAELVAERMRFRTWFEAGEVSGSRFHIEHGHQYDEFCSFEYNLAPYDDVSRREVAMPLAHRAIPYFTELLRSYAAQPVEDFDGRSALRFMASLGPRKAWVLFKVYLVAMLELLRQAGKKRRHELLGLWEEHRRELHALAANSPYDVGTLSRMDGLKAMPAEYSVIKMIRVFWLDVVLATAVAIAGTLVSLVIGGPAGLIFAVLVLSACIGMVQRGHRDRRFDIAGVLRRAAHRLAEVTQARYVTFGHSHFAELRRVGENAYYLNSGSWVTREVLRGEHGAGMTFVEITAEAAELKRWVGRDAVPRLLASSAQAIDVAVEAHQPRRRFGRAFATRKVRIEALRRRLEARRARKAEQRALRQERRPRPR